MEPPVLPAVELSRFDNSDYRPGRPMLIRVVWFMFGMPLLRASWIPSSAFRRLLLRCFGARIGTGVVCRPGVRVKYPWRFAVGDYSWIGEDSWIDNLGDVTIGRNCCLSQGSYLCTGNHDWSDVAFSLIVKEIRLEDGAWVGARATVLPGVTLHTGAVAAAGSVVGRSIPAHEIHAGNPAVFVRKRTARRSATPLPTVRPV